MNQGIDFSQIPLRDIHLPGAVAWWPPAPGWWVLLALAVGALVYWGVRFYKLQGQRLALRLMLEVKAELENGREPETCLQRLSSVV